MSNSPEADNSVLEICGQHPLTGHVSISGAKNSALVVMAGVLLCSHSCRLRNVPNLVDVERMSAVLQALGVKIRRDHDFLELDPSDISHTRAPYEIVSKLRASFFVIGPL
ncbi:MAG: UDP-N-acetylglucosamine 1-carboxyvinyltransferase, partial [Cyanobacteria bacterium P01_H01_bin.152]